MPVGEDQQQAAPISRVEPQDPANVVGGCISKSGFGVFLL